MTFLPLLQDMKVLLVLLLVMVALLLVLQLTVMAVLLLVLLVDIRETEEEPRCGCLAGQAMAGGLRLVLLPGGGEV